jgi:hypothetical protein
METCEKVLAVIKASNGIPCPKNREIAAAIGIKDGDVVSAALGLLVDEGTLERFGTKRRRRFRVVATGESTTPPVIQAKGVRERNSPNLAGALPAPIIYRDVKLRPRGGAIWSPDWPLPPTVRRDGL